MARRNPGKKNPKKPDPKNPKNKATTHKHDDLGATFIEAGWLYTKCRACGAIVQADWVGKPKDS